METNTSSSAFSLSTRVRVGGSCGLHGDQRAAMLLLLSRCLLRAHGGVDADLVAKDPRLLRAFLPHFTGEEEKLGPATMARLTDILRGDSSVKIGVIVDEVQAITNLVESELSAADAQTRAAVSYFHSGWYGWQGEPGRLFVRMDIASSHGTSRTPADEEVPTSARLAVTQLRAAQKYDAHTGVAFFHGRRHARVQAAIWRGGPLAVHSHMV